MLKILSEYNKYIMAGISMLLLVVFLAPTAVSRCSQANATPGTVWATTSDGGKFTLGDLEKVRGQLQALSVLRSAAMSVQARNYVSSSPGLLWLVGTNPKEPEYWWLLVREARAAGLIGGPGDGRALIDDMAPLLGVPPEQLLASLARESRQNTNNVLEALAELSGIGRLLELVAGAPRASEARLKLVARELMTSVNCDVVPLNAQLVGDRVQVAPPTPDQLEAQFRAARDFRPGTGPLGAGYRVDNKVSVEWLAIPGVDIARTVLNDPALGSVELRKEFLKNPSAYAPVAA
ncbi:MAG: hypothetical protein JNK53_04335, partial [Phycisphaerae bacterium]|nr:hypothetical protein [Phycisphaerae bacterium]